MQYSLFTLLLSVCMVIYTEFLKMKTVDCLYCFKNEVSLRTWNRIGWWLLWQSVWGSNFFKCSSSFPYVDSRFLIFQNTSFLHLNLKEPVVQFFQASVFSHSSKSKLCHFPILVFRSPNHKFFRGDPKHFLKSEWSIYAHLMRLLLSLIEVRTNGALKILCIQDCAIKPIFNPTSFPKVRKISEENKTWSTIALGNKVYVLQSDFNRKYGSIIN